MSSPYFDSNPVGWQPEASLRTEWPHVEFDRDDTAAPRLAAHLLDPFNEPKPLNLLLHGTNFQIKVWEAQVLKAVPWRDR